MSTPTQSVFCVANPDEQGKRTPGAMELVMNITPR